MLTIQKYLMQSNDYITYHHLCSFTYANAPTIN